MTRDRRESRRFRPPDHRREIQLVVKRRRFSGLMQEESSGGMTLLLESPVPLEVEQTAILETYDGNHAVRVVHVRQLDGQTHVGVRRLELEDDDIRQPSAPMSRMVLLCTVAVILCWLFVREILGKLG